MATLVDLEAVKLHLRKGSDTSEDTLIAAYRASAIAWVEGYTGHILVQRAVEDSFSAWGDYLTLRHQPITVGDPTPTLVVTYNDVEGDEVEYEDRVIRDQRYPWTIHAPYGVDFPTLGDNGTIVAAYTAGYAEDEIPDAINAAVLLLIGYWDTERAAETPAALSQLATYSGIPYPAITSLLRPFRGAVLA